MMGSHADARVGTSRFADAIEVVAVAEAGAVGVVEACAFVACVVGFVGHVPGVYGAAFGHHKELQLHVGCPVDIHLHVGPPVVGVGVFGNDAVGHTVLAALQGVVDYLVFVGCVDERTFVYGVCSLQSETGGEVLAGFTPKDEALPDGVGSEGVPGSHGAEGVGSEVEVAGYVEVGVAVVAAAGDEHHSFVAHVVDGAGEEGGAVEVGEGVHAPAAVDDESAVGVGGDVSHPAGCVDPFGLAEAEGAEQHVGAGCLAAEVAVGGAGAGGNAGHMGAVGPVAVEVRGVAFGFYEVGVAGDEGAIAQALIGGGGLGVAEVVPGVVDTPVVAVACVEVGVGVVEAPVGDADIHARAVVAVVDRQADAGFHLVGAGVGACVVHHGAAYGVRDAVALDVGVGVELGEAAHGYVEYCHIAGLGADGDAGSAEGLAVVARRQLGEEAQLGGSGGHLLGHECAGLDTALFPLSPCGG